MQLNCLTKKFWWNLVLDFFCTSKPNLRSDFHLQQPYLGYYKCVRRTDTPVLFLKLPFVYILFYKSDIFFEVSILYELFLTYFNDVRKWRGGCLWQSISMNILKNAVYLRGQCYISVQKPSKRNENIKYHAKLWA